MRKDVLSSFILGALIVVFTSSSFAQTTEFTYQGNLNVSNAPTTGNYDFEFALFDALTNGTQLGSTLTRSSVAVANGAFSVKLDFGAQFPGANRYIEIRVRQSGGGAFTPLTPRQQINSSPYSIKSVNADSATNATNAATATNSLQLGGVVANQYVLTGDARLTDARNPLPGSSNYIQNQNAGPQSSSNFNISGNGTAGGTLAGTNVMATNSFDMNAGGAVLYSRGTSNNPSLPPTNTFVGILSGVPTPVQLNSSDNSAFGYSSGFALTSGSSNSFFGSRTGMSNSTGTSNAFFGVQSGMANTSGGFNAMFGSNTGGGNTTGTHNSFFGQGAGFLNTTGTRNTMIGALADLGANNLTNATAIGANSRVDASNSMVLGSVININGALSNTNIGIGTTAPIERLHVVGNGLFTGNLTVNGSLNAPSFAGQFIQNTTTQQASSNFNISGNGIVGGTLAVGNASTSGRVFLNRASAVGANSSDISFYTAGTPDFSLGTSQGSAAATDFSLYNYGTSSNAFTVQRSTGFFGVGTTSPTERFHVSGNGIFTGGLTVGSNGNGLYVRPAFDGQSGPIDAIKIQGPNAPADANSAQDIRWSFASAGSSAIRSFRGQIWDTYLQFITSPVGANSPTVRMQISENGNVGIGTTSPAAKLHVNGDLITNILRINDLGQVGQVQDNLCAAGTPGVPPYVVRFCGASSIRFKTNVNPFNSGIDEIRQLHPVTFDWKSDGSHDFGLIAEDVAKVIPQLAYYNANGEPQGLRYDRIGVVLINAVNEQQTQLESLKKENDGLRNEVLELRDKLSAQQELLEAMKALVCGTQPQAAACRPSK